MPDINPNEEAGQRIQEKFQFYIVGLTFTILGLSVQTAVFGRNPFADILEILSWVALLGSGLLGLLRLHRIPYLYDAFGRRQKEQTKRDTAHVNILRGETTYTDTNSGQVRPMMELVTIGDQNVTTMTGIIEKWHTEMRASFRWQLRLGVGGLTTLIVARAFIPTARIVLAIAHHDWSYFF
jgi:hypothetical protein